MSALLTLDSVCQRFGASTALDAISLSVEQGEFIALLGPSGCGKTTLLRTIAGFLTPTSGRILIEDKDVSAWAPYRRPLNTVFQNYALFPHLSVLGNVMYGPRRAGVARRDAQAQSHEALALVGLTDFAARFPRELSGGQQQRVALARAIVNRPKLLLLDEPLSALDLKLRKRVQLELKHLQQKLGIAFLFVTHDQEEAMTMADRIVVMHGGRIEQVGTGTEIYRRPASRFVAEFIGDANILPWSCDDQARVTLDGTELAMPGHIEVPPVARGIAVLRPEDIHVSPTRPHATDDASSSPTSADAAPDTNETTIMGSPSPRRDPSTIGSSMSTPPAAGCMALTAVVTDLVSIGSHTVVHAQAGEHKLLARLPGLPDASLASGQTVTLSWRAACMHLIGDAA